MRMPASVPGTALPETLPVVSLMLQPAERMIWPFCTLAVVAGGVKPIFPSRSMVSAWFFGTATM